MTSLETLSFEDALRELETIVRQLEEGKTNLEEAIKAYERGAVLRTICEKKLKEAHLRVEKIVMGPEGTITSQPCEIEE